MERLIRNITISVLNDARTTTTTNVTTIEYKAAYVFKDQPRLIAAYAATLGICLFFVLLGLFASIRTALLLSLEVSCKYSAQRLSAKVSCTGLQRSLVYMVRRTLRSWRL